MNEKYYSKPIKKFIADNVSFGEYLRLQEIFRKGEEFRCVNVPVILAVKADASFLSRHEKAPLFNDPEAFFEFYFDPLARKYDFNPSKFTHYITKNHAMSWIFDRLHTTGMLIWRKWRSAVQATGL